MGISRQALHVHLKKLIQQNLVVKEGRTRGTVYYYAPGYKKVRKEQKFKKKYLLKNLEEHIVYKEVEMFLNLKKHLRENVLDIFHYAFTEILNNAIEHSGSKDCSVEVLLDPYHCKFHIRDYGIGLYYSIYKRFHLPDEFAAMGELIKGKTTTMEERHSGEGIFFTSKSSDRVSFRAHKINLLFDNKNNDVIVEEKRFLEGTSVTFEIGRNSKRKLEDIFAQYAPADYDYRFEKTRVYVKLFQRDYVSRSEAKRLLSGLDKFKEIILDFHGVKSLGQGFADEIFRVFHTGQPDIKIRVENLSPSIAAILSHIVDNNI